MVNNIACWINVGDHVSTSTKWWNESTTEGVSVDGEGGGDLFLLLPWGFSQCM